MIAALLTMGVFTQAHAACRPGTSSTTLDVSHDLRSLPADPPFQQNMKPGNPHFDVTGLLNRAIAYAAANGCTKIVGDAGDYYFRNPYRDRDNQLQPWYILLDGTNNLSVEFPGSTFIFTQPAFTAFRAQNCENCVIKGMAIDYSILPFTQLTVTGIDSKTGQVIAVPLPGYPHLDAFTKRMGPNATEFVAFDLRQNLIQYSVSGTNWNKPTPPNWIEGNRIQFGASSAYFQKGDTLILAARGGGPAIFVVYGKQVTIDGVTIYTSAGPGIEINNSSGVTIDHMVIEPRPNTGRLADVVAGGIQLNDMGQDIAVRQSTIISAQDDSIAGNAPVDVPVPDLNLVVVGNTIVNSYLARGIALTSVVGAHITQNRIDGTQQAGIYVGGANTTLEQPTGKVQITDNALNNTNAGPDNVGLDMLGAIEVMYYQGGQAVTNAPNSKIFIDNNTIESTPRAGIWVGNVTGGVVKNNIVQNYGLSKGALGDADHLNNGLRFCVSALFTQNIVNWYSRNVDGVGTALPVCSTK